MVSVLSLVVFGATWYGWAQVQQANSGLTRSDVISDGGKNTTGPQNILLVGIDTRVDAQGNPLPSNVLNQLHAGSATDGADATDTMIIVHIPAGGGQATGFSIPRDAYVQLAGGFGTHKINSAYTYAETAALQQLRAHGVTGSQLWLQAAQAGAKNSIATVEQLTGLTINHYAAVNLVGFYNISNAVGGVQVCLNRASRDSYSGANFSAGVQTIQGVQALAFVRQRHDLPNGDLDRIKRQQVFMAAMARTVLSGRMLANPTKLSGLIDSVQKSISLDQDWNILGFAQQLQGISGGAIQFRTIPIVNITLHTPEDGDAVQVDPQQVKAFIAAHINGSGTAPSSPSAPTSPTPPANAAVTVDVENANGISGLASRVMDVLTSHGYTAGVAVSAASRTHSAIDYAPGEQTAAQQVASVLGGGITLAEDSALPAGHVRVYLGENYRGPGNGPASTSSQEAVTQVQPAPPPDAPITASGVPCIN